MLGVTTSIYLSIFKKSKNKKTNKHFTHNTKTRKKNDKFEFKKNKCDMKCANLGAVIVVVSGENIFHANFDYLFFFIHLCKYSHLVNIHFTTQRSIDKFNKLWAHD